MKGDKEPTEDRNQSRSNEVPAATHATELRARNPSPTERSPSSPSRNLDVEVHALTPPCDLKSQNNGANCPKFSLKRLDCNLYHRFCNSHWSLAPVGFLSQQYSAMIQPQLVLMTPKLSQILHSIYELCRWVLK